ncbi:MAG: hypothetical protein ACK5PF_05925 [bacterium]|jgi:hypothetical protein
MPLQLINVTAQTSRQIHFGSIDDTRAKPDYAGTHIKSVAEYRGSSAEYDAVSGPGRLRFRIDMHRSILAPRFKRV